MAYTLYYHSSCKKFIGRAHGTVMILEQAGAKYEVKEPKDAPTGFPTLATPIVKLPDGTVIAQQAAIATVLGKQLNLSPKTAADEAVAMTIANNTTDLFSEMGKDDARLSKWMQTYETALERAGKGFLVGDSLTYADLCSYLLVAKIAEHVSPPPKVKQWIDMMANTTAGKSAAAKVPFLPDAFLPKHWVKASSKL